jgi:hypothetical protein
MANYPIQPPIPSTSKVAPGIPVAGTQLQAGNGADLNERHHIAEP